MANSHSLDLESGSSQYAQATDSASLSPTAAITIEGWFKFETLPANGALFQLAYKNPGYEIYLYNDAGNYELTMEITEDTNRTVRDVFKYIHAFTTGTWFHIAISADSAQASASTFKFYIDTDDKGNGTSVVSGNATSIFDNAINLFLGATNAPASFFNGLINSFRVWSDVRTPTEISDNWKTSTPVGDNLSMSSLYNNDYNDDSGNSNTLSPTADPVFSTDIPYSEGGAILDLTSKMW